MKRCGVQALSPALLSKTGIARIEITAFFHPVSSGRHGPAAGPSLDHTAKRGRTLCGEFSITQSALTFLPRGSHAKLNGTGRGAGRFDASGSKSMAHRLRR